MRTGTASVVYGSVACFSGEKTEAAEDEQEEENDDQDHSVAILHTIQRETAAT